ncbi:efflux RND transporter permease subunit [Bradymonas sediminis]|uniref:Uncharacterized protein n=1 Tax=Bradymonas sediminis TaxID=1548548 RepID=A0A2Z4FHZ6_9DELT|nr:MMPL family transporter [Bradymonas sediminis]AWV88631.1 hypothetical protein DN745_04480 [Bradymonas sediminis]TDP63685.1 MMPL family protein [Bradymonas sediminis]
MTSFMKRFIAFFIGRVIAPHYWAVSAISILLSVLSVWVIATQANINSDFKALLPTTSAAYQAMDEVGGRVGSGSALFVVVDSPDTEANKRFAEVYANTLRELPDVALAHYHNDKSFFEKNKLLYLDKEDLSGLRERIADKIKDAKRKANPLFVSLGFDDDEEDDALLNTSELEEKYSNLSQNSYKEYLISDDGYSLTIVVRFVESSTDLASTEQLIARVQQVGADLEPAKYHPEMKLEYGGGLINRQAEYSSIVDDIKTSAWSTIIGLFLVIGLYFRRVRAVFFVLAPLIMGVAWTLAFSFWFFGELTTVATFIFAVLLGLGIDYSIHFLNEYDIYRRKGFEPVDALVECFGTTGRATVIGGVSTMVTFVVLAFAQFRGLSQFGQVASIGIVCTLIAMLVVLPAMILTVHRILPYDPPLGEKDEAASMLSPAYWVDEVRAKPLAPVFLGIALLISVFAGYQLQNVEFEENFRVIGKMQLPWQGESEREAATKQAEKLAKRQARLTERRARAVREAVDPETYIAPREQKSVGDKYTSATSGMRSSTPTLLLFDEEDQAREVYEYMAEQHANGELDAVRSVSAIYSFVPGTIAEQEERMVEINAIRELLEDDDISFLKADERKRIDEMRDSLDVKPFTAHDLPDWTKRLFKEAGDQAKAPDPGEEFAFGYLIYVNESIDSMKGEQARRFLGQMEDVKEATQVDFRVGSQSYIYIAMLDQIKTDGLRMMSIALLMTLLVLMWGFGNPLRALYALLPVLIGMFWMLGVAGFIGLNLDFFNVIIIPVLIGAGVDDGVHFYAHYRAQGRGSVGAVMKSLGGALVMTTITSAIGFMGLAVTDYGGLKSMGYLAIIGLSMTLLGTMLVLPAILWLAEKYDIHWLAQD